MSPEAVPALIRRNYELECENKVRRKEAKILRDELAKRAERLISADAQTEQLTEKATKLEAQAEKLKAKIAWYEKQLFGAKSERRILEAMSDSDQLWLGEQMLKTPDEPPTDGESVTDTEAKARRTKRPKSPRSEESIGSRLHFDSSVPIKEVTVKDAELEAQSKDQVEIIGQDVTYKLAQRSPYYVIKTIRTAWRKKGEKTINKSALPTVVERSIADVSFLAGLAVDKICHHLPLYRQHQRLEQAGIHIDRSTLTRLLLRVAEMCELTYQAQLSSILMSKVITMDESPTPAGRLGGKMKLQWYPL